MASLKDELPDETLEPFRNYLQKYTEVAFLINYNGELIYGTLIGDIKQHKIKKSPDKDLHQSLFDYEIVLRIFSESSTKNRSNFISGKNAF